jgi:hypothetical protein
MAIRHVRFRSRDPYRGLSTLSFRGGQLVVAEGQVADLTDEEIAAHSEAIFTDVVDPVVSPGGVGPQGPPGNILLQKASISAAYTAPSNVAVDVPALAINVTEDTLRPYLLTAFTYGLAGSLLNNYVYMTIVEYINGVAQPGVAIGENYVTGIANTGRTTTIFAIVDAPAAVGAVRTFRVQISGGAGGVIPTLQAAATSKAFLMATLL